MKEIKRKVPPANVLGAFASGNQFLFAVVENGTKPKVATFYSFKGGMGRTTSLVAVALGLAREGKGGLRRLSE